MSRRKLLDAYRVDLRAPVNLSFDDRRGLTVPSRYRGPATYCERLHDVYLNAKGELFKNGGILGHSYPLGDRNERRDGERLARAAQRTMADAAQAQEGSLFVTDRWSANYYHWLCDALPRLEAWLSKGGVARLLLPANVLQQPFVRESLDAYEGIVLDPIAERFPNLHAATLDIVTHTAQNGFQHPELTGRVVQRLKRLSGGRVARAPGRRLYVTRRKARMRRVANENEIAPVLARHGFRTVIFDDMALADQIALMEETEMLAGPHGAGLTNMMFMPPGGAVLEIRQIDGPPNCFVSLASTCGHGHFYLGAAPTDDEMHYHGADIVAHPAGLDAVLSGMEQWLGGKEKGPAA